MKYVKYDLIMRIGSRTKIDTFIPTKATVWINPHTEDKGIIKILLENGMLSKKDIPFISIKHKKNEIFVKTSKGRGYPVPYFTLIPKTEMGI